MTYGSKVKRSLKKRGKTKVLHDNNKVRCMKKQKGKGQLLKKASESENVAY